VVPMQPPGPRSPGTIARAISPANSPKMIQLMMPTGGTLYERRR